MPRFRLAKKPRNRRKKTPWQIAKPILQVLGVTGLLSLGAWQLYQLDVEKLTQVEISWQIDNELLNPQSDLEAIVKPLSTNHYTLELNTIKQALEQLPWVAKANIKRDFFNHIQITISTQEVHMRWRNIRCQADSDTTQCRGLISTQGELFMPEILPDESDKPLIVSSSQRERVMQAFLDFQHYQTLLKPMVLKTLAQGNIDTLTVHPKTTVVLGHQLQDERLKRFKSAYPELAKRTAKVKTATFDMRYPKGFSVDYDF